MIALVGKTSSGKTVLQKELIKLGFKPIVSYTTRPKRPHETDGVEYHFVSKETFMTLLSENIFAETTSYQVANGETWYYGTAKVDLTDDKVAIFNPEGLRNIKTYTDINPIAFYLKVSDDIIWNRLRQRGDNAEEARRRLKSDNEDFSKIEDDVDFVIRNDLGISVDKMAFIVADIYTSVNKERGDLY